MVALGKLGKELFSRGLQLCARVAPRLGNGAWAGLGWLVVLCTERLPVQFLVRAHAYVAGLIPSLGAYRR